MLRFFNYEQRLEPLLPVGHFLARIILNTLAAGILIALFLGVGIAGYQRFEGLSPVDAFLHAAMLLSGMGAMDMPATVEGKVFAGLYALVSGFIVVLATTVILAPIVHRVLHVFHLDDA